MSRATDQKLDSIGVTEMMRRLLAPALALLALAAMPTSFAQAQGFKNYAGSQCIRFRGGTPTLSNSVILNTTTDMTMGLDCPGVLHKGPILSAFIKVIDVNPSQDLTCELVTTWQSGRDTFFNKSPRLSTFGFSDSYQKLSFGRILTMPESYFYFSCNVPPRAPNGGSGVAMYQVVDEPL